MKPRHMGLYSNPIGRLYEYLRGGFWTVAELAILEGEFSYAAEELAWAWDQLLWTYWEPRAPRRRVKGLEKRLVEAHEALPEEARRAFLPEVFDALGHYDPPCYSDTLLRIAFGPDMAVPFDVPVPVKALDSLRLIVRKEYRLLPDRAMPECPCQIVAPEGLFSVLARFYEYVGYRTSAAPPLGMPPQVVSLFDNEIDVFDVAAIERAVFALCRRTPQVYRPEVVIHASRLYQRFPSATLERLIADREW